MFSYKGLKINYSDNLNQGKDAIVYLHGWGQNIEMMEPIAKPFYETHRVIIIDLPGFGKSSEPNTVWHINDFVEMVNMLLDVLNISEPTLIGHSFGGKISLQYASIHKTKKLVLLASPFKASKAKPKLSMRILKKLEWIPIVKKLKEKLKKNIGSTDYRNATPMMRNILVKHVNTDLTESAKKITCPTLIVWGSLDTAVPLSDAYELEKLIKDSGVVKYDNATHYAYLERLQNFIKVLKSFI